MGSDPLDEYPHTAPPKPPTGPTATERTDTTIRCGDCGAQVVVPAPSGHVDADAVKATALDGHRHICPGPPNPEGTP